MSELATKKGLEQATTQLRGEMKQLRGEMKHDLEQATTQLRGEMKHDLEQATTQLRGEMKHDLEQATTQLRGEMKHDLEQATTQLRGEMKHDLEQATTQLRGEMKAMGEQLRQYFDTSGAHIANVVAERFRHDFSAIDDKYKDLPGRHKELRDEFEAHAGDLRMHSRLPPVPAKRVRRPRSQ
jgi:DNA anti-recombination protein RmuC